MIDQVLKLTLEEIEDLHQQTECSFFKPDEETGKFNIDSLQKDVDGYYIYGVDKFEKNYPEIDITGLKQGDFEPIIEEI